MDDMHQRVFMNDEDPARAPTSCSSGSSYGGRPGDDLAARASESAISRRRYWQETTAARRSLDLQRSATISRRAGALKGERDSVLSISADPDEEKNKSATNKSRVDASSSNAESGANLRSQGLSLTEGADIIRLDDDCLVQQVTIKQTPNTSSTTNHKESVLFTSRAASFGLSMLSALGVVYGDIGTSPLYTYSSLIGGSVPTEYEAMAAFSLVFWAITITVCIKYIAIVLIASLNGEGGVYVLYQLVRPHISHSKVLCIIAIGVAMVGVSLLTADGVLTPAVSVYSAVSGLTVLIPSMPAVAITSITCIILIVLFLCQRWGSVKLGWLFGPIVTVWLLTIGIVGCVNVSKNPKVFQAFNPYYAITSLGHTWSNGELGIWKLGDVLLSVTGAEAIYADIGHFGKGPVRVGWLVMVYPCLIMQYLGQTAATLANPSLGAESTLFFQQVSGDGLRWYLLILSTFATIFASQAMISGAFATLHQAQAVECFPPIKVIHGSNLYGQVYMPTVNYILMVLCVGVVIVIDNGTQLTAAYGVSVAGSFVCTTIAFTIYLIWKRRSPFYVWIPFFAFFMAYDLLFLVGALYKVPHGGWISLTMATVTFLFMLCWYTGRHYEAKASMTAYETVETFADNVQDLARYPGVGVFMSRRDSGMPKIMRIVANDTVSLPQSCIILTLRHTHVPFVAENDRFYFGDLGNGIYRLIVCIGFAEDKSRVMEFLQVASLHYPELTALLQGEKGLTFYTGAVKVEAQNSHVLVTPKTVVLYIYGIQKSVWPMQDNLELPQHFFTVYELCKV